MKTGEPLKGFNGPEATEVKEWGNRLVYPIQNDFLHGALHCILSIWGQISILHLTAEI